MKKAIGLALSIKEAKLLISILQSFSGNNVEQDFVDELISFLELEIEVRRD